MIEPPRPLSAGELPWLAAIPLAIVVVLAIVWLGPPLGSVLPADHRRFWPSVHIGVRPEPTEQARYLVALAAPLALALLTFSGARRRWAAPVHTGMLVTAAQAALIVVVLVCVLRQHGAFGPLYAPDFLLPPFTDWFPPWTLAVALTGGLIAVAALRDARLRERVAGLARETQGRAWVAGAAAVLAVVVWLLHAIYTEGTIGTADEEVLFHIRFTLDETFAVLDGHTPLVDYATQYGALWSAAAALGLDLLGRSVGVWVAMAVCTTGVAMLAIHAVLRRVSRSSTWGLLLFLPVLATSFLTIAGSPANRYTFGTYYGTFPMRYAGPSLLAWLLVRHLAHARPRHAWTLFLAAGVVALNNADVGLPALAATLAALLWSADRPAPRELARLALQCGAGLGGAYALVAAFTLARAGALPDLGLLVYFSRLFGAAGFGLYPMPALGLHIVIYLTYVAALAAATVRAVRGDADRPLTGMLAWSAVFGLCTASYFVGRSTSDDLGALLFPWSFALALLTILAVRTLSEAAWRRSALAAGLCVGGYLLLCTSLVQTPTPWEQLGRLRDAGRPVLARPAGQAFVAEHVSRDEPVAILLQLGHRMAVNLGVENVSPYANSLSMPAMGQLGEVVSLLRRAGGDKLFIDPSLIMSDEMQSALARAGFVQADLESGAHAALWIDQGSG